MLHLTINGKAVEVPEGSTIMEAAEAAGVKVPSLCHMKNVHQYGSCRICVVEVEGMKNLQASCMAKVREGMVIRTHSPKVLAARKVLYELLLSNHPKDCLNCSRNTNCELQELGYELGVSESRFEGAMTKPMVDISPSITRDTSKCVLCRRCVTVCTQIQKVGAIQAQNRGFDTVVSPAMGLPLNSTACAMCGQCTVVCPTGALKETDGLAPVWRALADPEKRVVVQVAPAVRAALGEEFGLPVGTPVTGKMATALHEIGFDDVFDTLFSADLTILEEGTELLGRLNAALKGDESQKEKAVLPMITSCSPGWIKHIEHQFPEELDHLSTCKSPHTMLGAVVKSFYAERTATAPENMFVVSVMPCTAKKYEIQRPEMEVDGNRDVDAVLTTRELARIPEQDDVKEENKTLRAAAADVSASPDVTVVDYDGEYTAAEIAKMRAEKQKEIRDLDLKLRMDKVELERMKQEAANGVVTSKLDGTVLRVNDPDTAKQEGSPVVIVSGGGGYYVKTGVTELDRDKYPVGTQMRIQSWEHGEVYGTVAEISDTPVPSSNNPYYSSGNQNVSFYTMLIALDADSPLREDEWVDVYFNAASTTSEDALCIETRFIRQDDGGSYVYRRGEDQLLHKQYVTTGVVQWGYTEIKSGLTVDDWIAFPYGKDVKENAETIESDNSDDFYYYGSY